MASSADYRTLYSYATVSSLSNSLLRPERTAVTNVGVDFATKNNLLSGSIEYYSKVTKDLLSFAPLDPSLGVSGQTYNVGNIKGSGVDLHIRSVNLKLKSFTWESNFNFSFNDVKVTKNYVPASIGSGTLVSGSTFYFADARLSSLYAYQWGGLNPQTGAARAIAGADKLEENSYTVPVTELKNVGSSVPLYYGSLSNTFSYQGFSLWANIMYKLKYFNRRPASMLFLNYNQMGPYSPQQVAGAEYASRWQKSGDENVTNVPSRDLTRSSGNDDLYQYADINTYNAGNIRLQEVNLSYNFNKNFKYIKNPRLYVTVPVNWVIWRANKLGLDPDVYDLPIPRAYGFGMSANF
jgi:hypothetical protein